MHRLEFYFDCSSPWTYLAFEQAQTLLHGLDVELVWKPILVGGIFNTVNPSVYAMREKPVPLKAAYAKKDLQDWARFVGVEIGAPPVFPVNSVKAMRGAFLAIEQQRLIPYARAVFQAYWRDLLDISQDDVLRPLVSRVGLNVDDFYARIGSDDYKNRLRVTTDEVMARGGFGSPTFFLDGDDMYFGNDRLVLIRDKIMRAK